MNFEKILFFGLTAVLLSGLSCVYAENIDPNEDGSQYAYGENVGWVNLEPDVPGEGTVYGVTVSDDELTGWAWGENIGWISLMPLDYGGVFNDGWGDLYGEAWGENVGWIYFDPQVAGDPHNYGVNINSEGDFLGWAWGENIGWIHFEGSGPIEYGVKTLWRPAVCYLIGEARGVCGEIITPANYAACLMLNLEDREVWCCPYQPCGDANGDGYVNPEDYLTIFANIGFPSTESPRADVNHDGYVNPEDYLTVFENIGIGDGQVCEP